MEKKVFLMAYARGNLGDDLFIKKILQTYPDVNFYIKIPNSDFLEGLSSYKNLTILIGNDTDEELYHTNVEDYDAYLYIGGSIFMEGGKVYNLSPKFYDFIYRCKQKNIPFFYISCNYGPYQTQEYLDLSKKAFQTCTDICFRDTYSFHLFSNISTVRYAPDYLFSYPKENIEQEKDSIGISLIDLDIRASLKYKKEDYYSFLIYNIKEYLKKNKKVYLISFCQNEGDEKTVQVIKNFFNNNPNVETLKYDGDINQFMLKYAKIEYMICTRFHAMVLSCVNLQKMFILSYSSKIDYVVKDLNLNIPTIHIEDVQPDLYIGLEKFVSVPSFSLEKIVHDAHQQEKAFQNYIMNNSIKK